VPGLQRHCQQRGVAQHGGPYLHSKPTYKSAT
jgi:hypothetical protein